MVTDSQAESSPRIAGRLSFCTLLLHVVDRASGEALASEAITDTPWLEVPIGVYVHHPDYENLSFTYKLGDGQLKLRRLKLKKR